MIDSPCKFVSQHLTDESRAMLSKTTKDGLERGFILFQQGDEIHRTDIQTGTKRSIMLRTEQPLIPRGPKKELIATFHTHPDQEFDWLFSLTDIRTMINGDFPFSGVVYRQAGDDFLKVFSSMKFETFDQLMREITSETIPSGVTNLTEDDIVDIARVSNDRLELCTIRL